MNFIFKEWRGRRRWAGARVSELFYKESKKKLFLLGEGGGDEGRGLE